MRTYEMLATPEEQRIVNERLIPLLVDIALKTLVRRVAERRSVSQIEP